MSEVITIRVLLEDTNLVASLKAEAAALRAERDDMEVKLRRAQMDLINEMTLSMRLQDEVRLLKEAEWNR